MSRGPTPDDPLTDTAGIDRLLEHAATTDAIERAATDPEFARIVVDGLKADYVLHAADEGDWAVAMSLAYTNAQKAVTALLVAHGWRIPDQPGKHARFADAVEAWLGPEGGSGPRLARSYSNARKARNNEQYPDSRAPLPDDDALRQIALDSSRLVQRVRRELGLPHVDGSIPTDESIKRWKAQRM